MPSDPTVTQESRTQKVAIAVTPSEKDAIDIYVKVHRPEGGASGLLRDKPFQEVVTAGRKMLDRLAEDVA
ncbi:MAG: hypothetical protein GWO12_17140 [Gemmatimonadetes bacterium]|uniref:Uncharacterized protein n=1 Tax=Candidatus Kutchimonas denitrificans TaxID=3056748 RepID=A0AAE4ZB50_9BACT|nr:hypothetical protein [Candidatus Kutchimonas denitrificans]